MSQVVKIHNNATAVAAKKYSITPYKKRPAFSIQSHGEQLLANEHETSTSTMDAFYAPEDDSIIEQERRNALQSIEEMLAEAQVIQRQITDALMSGPVCPYEQTLVEYLGPNFICPTIHDLEMPQNFRYLEAIKFLDETSKKFEDKLFEHIAVMSAEAMDMSIEGITSENLGHAFSELSATASGPQYIINKQKMANHLAFAEIIRHIPTDYIIENPVIVALKLVNFYIAINSD